MLDEPTTGLHFGDVERLLVVVQRLVDAGNSVLVIEHHMDVIRACDWLIDLGPEGGAGGGLLIAEGTPEQVAKVKASHTGKFLAIEQTKPTGTLAAAQTGSQTGTTPRPYRSKKSLLVSLPGKKS